MREAFQLVDLKNFRLEQLTLDSQVLKGNPLKDPTKRSHPILTPQKQTKGESFGLVLVLAGFTGNSPRYLYPRGFELSLVEQLDQMVTQGKAPLAVYVFVDAWTFWGGSQFLNSEDMGYYESHILEELLPSLIKDYSIDPQKRAVFGGSSGGYGAIHLMSKYPEIFPYGGAIAPDSFFETCYLPDLYKASVYLKNKSYQELKTLHQEGKILARRGDGHAILNSIAMTTIYSGLEGKNLNWPIDMETGSLRQKVWEQWKEKDPVVFLEQRQNNLKKIQALFLEVGAKDQFHLQFGARQIHKILRTHQVEHHFFEFDGNHFDLAERRPAMWHWLSEVWK